MKTLLFLFLCFQTLAYSQLLPMKIGETENTTRRESYRYLDTTISINNLEIEKLALQCLLDSVFAGVFDYDRPVYLVIAEDLIDILPPLEPNDLPQKIDNSYGYNYYLEDKESWYHKMKDSITQIQYIYNIDFSGFRHPYVNFIKDRDDRKFWRSRRRNRDYIYKYIKSMSAPAIFFGNQAYVQFVCEDVIFYNYTVYESGMIDFDYTTKTNQLRPYEIISNLSEISYITLKFKKQDGQKWQLAGLAMEADSSKKCIYVESFYDHIRTEQHTEVNNRILYGNSKLNPVGYSPISKTLSEMLHKSNLTSERPGKKRFFNKQ